MCRLLDLASNQLSGRIPSIPNLQYLDLSSNHFTELNTVPATLQLMYLANNRVTGNILHLGSHLAGEHSSALKLLDLSYNSLSDYLPQNMPPSLSVLNISNNAFVGSLPTSWSMLQNMTGLRLDNNQLTGPLPEAWSVWGSNTANSIQLSITNAGLHGRMPRKWVEQFCLAVVRNNTARVLFQPLDLRAGNTTFVLGPLIELLAQQATINVTLAGEDYTFDYNNPDSVCGIARAARNVAVL